jgi:hypothetical protein
MGRPTGRVLGQMQGPERVGCGCNSRLVSVQAFMGCQAHRRISDPRNELSVELNFCKVQVDLHGVAQRQVQASRPLQERVVLANGSRRQCEKQGHSGNEQPEAAKYSRANAPVPTHAGQLRLSSCKWALHQPASSRWSRASATVPKA